MENHLGNTFRIIRKNKEISICSLSDQIISKSQISRFERGESDISCQKIIHLLDKLNITLDEFFILHKNLSKEKNDFWTLMEFIRIEHTANRTSNLKKLITDENVNIDPFKITMIKSVIFSIDSSNKPNDDEILKLTDYLFKIENWGYYEIILLGNCVRLINYDTVILLTLEMIKNYINSKLNQTNKKLVIQLSINCLFMSIQQKNIKDCLILIDKIKELLHNEIFFYEKTVFLYALGYYEFCVRSQQKLGIEKMNQAMQVLKLINEKNLFKNYFEHYSSIIKNNKN
ncbi:helix-turn-helix domain-containing protein [uncultured Enterococcus sp.]|uniref:helix-turn-helix domain-containing protein n=1 Tax=uncultured Enterococcus sp. TaxID=167972 RepID=UPI0022D202FF|nr:Rgg/GadR/MutR family transcriptional regulator [uncultured Enterococcus sp.]CAI3400529.1 Rgg/GadR/MutR family transcriptional regulator [Enterococcus cecorum]